MDGGFMNYTDLDKMLEAVNFLAQFFVQPLIQKADGNALASAVYGELVNNAYTVPEPKE